jgi:hypothetical protein
MPSPFPGMDPYLEESWGDVHHRLITYAADQLQTTLPKDLRARVEERVFVESEVPRRTLYPDIRVVERTRPRQDKDAALDLQAILDQCYRNGDYDDIDYGAEPEPSRQRALGRSFASAKKSAAAKKAGQMNSVMAGRGKSVPPPPDRFPPQL